MKVSNRHQSMDRCGNVPDIKYEMYIRIWSGAVGTVFVFSLPLVLKIYYGVAEFLMLISKRIFLF